jgi:hypothetical protein
MAILKDIENLSTDIDTARAGFFDTYKFGYLGEINSSHNTDYPLLLLLPPSSTFITPYNNDETITLIFHCYEPLVRIADELSGVITTPQNDTVSLERTFDKLLEQFKGTIQALVKDQEHKYIIPQDSVVEIDRVSQEFNDNLVGIIVTLRLKKFTHCLLY